MKNMKEYFDEEAAGHDELFVQKMGMGEFYEAIENELNGCKNKEAVLVLGCGTGLEIERIKFPANVVAVDISEKMLEVLNRKNLHKDIKLTTICASFLNLEFECNKYDIVLSCYAMHHFDIEQKKSIYQKIYECLKVDGVFINGDSMAVNREQEECFRKNAEQIYEKENLPFGSLHVDAPFCWEHEQEVLRTSHFSEVCLIKEWTKTKLYRCRKYA